MKGSVLLLTLAVCLSTAASSDAATDVRFWHRKHKDSLNAAASEPTKAPQPKTKRSLLHRTKPSREQAARSEAAFGMAGPKSVGFLHPQPGPAGAGAK